MWHSLLLGNAALMKEIAALKGTSMCTEAANFVKIEKEKTPKISSCEAKKENASVTPTLDRDAELLFRDCDAKKINLGAIDTD